MPNWCNNFASVTGPKDRIAELKEAYDRGEFCNAVVPVPKALTETVAGSVPEGAERDAHEAQMKRNLELYGAKDWYDFCVARWGTKWDFGGDGGADVDDEGECLTISFDSAWSPPTGIYEALTEQGLTVEACYYESGMCFAGMWTSECGDDCYDLSNMSADEIADTIPQELDDCMGITEGIREYEAENQEPEELTEWIKEGAEKKAQLIAG